MNSSDHTFFYPLQHIFREKVLDLRPKSVCAVEKTMNVHWTCMSTKDVHALIISINGKDMNEEYMCIAQFEKKMKTTTIFFLKNFL